MSAAVFQQAVAAFQAGDMAEAQRQVGRVLAAQPRQPDALHLAALISRQLGRQLEALQQFEASLRASPHQPVVLSNLGNLLRDLGRHEEAEQRYRRAVELMPRLADAWYQRGLLAMERHQPGEAISHLSKARELDVQPRVLVALASAQLEAGKPADALLTAREFGRIAPTDARAVALEARALSLLEDRGAARVRLQAALGQVDDPASLHHELGLLALEEGNAGEAMACFRAAVHARPEFIDAHRALNRLQWEAGEAAFTESYRQALEQAPTFAPLHHHLAAACIASGDEAAATEVLERALDLAGPDPFLLHGLAVQHLKGGDFARARAGFDRALAARPDELRFLIDRANLALREAEPEVAQQSIGRALQVSPHHQEAWAYQGILWRLSGDARHDWLNDYERLLRDYELPVPPGFTSVAEFMQALASELVGRHTAVRQPLDQSVRHGTQTTGVLLDDPHPLLAALRSAIDTCLQDYLAGLKPEAGHPLRSRLGRGARFAGSWSVSLGGEGYHANHVHPLGWLSCCTYVALPEAIGSGDDDRRGWIKFGETALGLPGQEQVARAIQPRVGHCVFFPAYFWHGTYPFADQGRRLTVPCDFEPA
ncbi:MAG: tetratricopeptide repeat protein [Steroidobacteraceae bacterium]